MSFFKKTIKGFLCVIVIIPFIYVGGVFVQVIPFMAVDGSNLERIVKNPWGMYFFIELFLAFSLPWVLPIVAKYHSTKKGATFISACILSIAFVPVSVLQNIFILTNWPVFLYNIIYSILFPIFWICFYGVLLMLVARLFFRFFVFQGNQETINVKSIVEKKN